jgi:jumonji domain-containing protein 2
MAPPTRDVDGAEDGGLLVLRPTPEQFGKPFTQYVRSVLKQHPDVPMFKVVPPAGWKPRR